MGHYEGRWDTLSCSCAMNQGITMANSILEPPCTKALDHAKAGQGDTTGHSSNNHKWIHASEKMSKESGGLEQPKEGE